MPKQLHIYAYGDVENIQVTEASEYGIVSLKGIAEQINNNPDAEEIVVHIHSRGGDVTEGFAIHDVLVNSGKKVITIVEGLCASIATVIALAGSVRKMTKNSEFFIHNPWTIGMGDAESLHKTADMVKAAEDKLVRFYHEKTGAEEGQLRDMMKNETSMTTAEALEFKFITEEIPEAKAVTKVKIYAKLPVINNQPKQNDMAKNTKAKAILAKLGEILNIDVKALDLKDADGKPVHVDTEADAPAVGDHITVDGKEYPNGETKLESGVTLKTDDKSNISEIVPAKEEEAAADAKPEDAKPADAVAAKVVELEASMTTLKAEIETLKKDKKALEDEAAENETLLETIEARMKDLAKNVKSNHKPEDDEPAFNKGVKKAASDAPGSDAAARIREKAKARLTANKK